MKFKIGDSVIIASTPQTGWYLTWEPKMDDHCGCSGEVISIDWMDDCPIYAVRSKSNSGIEKSWWYQDSWLQADSGYYWSSNVSREEYQKRGLEELKREEAALKEKQDAIFRKIFSDD